MPGSARPRALLLAFGLLLAGLVATSSPQRVGDAREYIAMGLTLSRLHSPALSPDDVSKAELALARAGFTGLPLTTYPRLRDRAGRQDFFHFWFYPAIAAPALSVAALFHLHPNFGFVALNVLLFLGSLWVVARRVSWWVVAPIFCSPVLWWIDKAHTEIFTFSLLAAAIALVRTAPWWSMVAIGAAATQNLPIAALLPVVAVVAGQGRRTRRFRAGAAAGVALALLHPLYYEWRWRVPTPQLFQGTRTRMPSLEELGAVVWDPNIGLAAHAPLLLLAFMAAAVVAMAGSRKARRLPVAGPEAGTSSRAATDAWLALAAAAVFLWSFSQTTNFNHGGTYGMSRYAVWLIPLTLPVLERASRFAPARSVIACLALASCAWSATFSQPRQLESYCTPTRLATVTWNRWPALDNPLPEVFAERLSGVEPAKAPVANAGCTKVLVVGGLWPLPCIPQRVPDACASPGSLCYANLRGGGYDFVTVAPPAGYTLQGKGTWVADAESAREVEGIVRRVRWRELRRVTPLSPARMAIGAANVAWTEVFEGTGEVMAYARQPRAGASLLLRVPTAMTGWLLDPATGRELQAIEIAPSTNATRVDLPVRTEVVLVVRARTRLPAAVNRIDGAL